MVGARNVKYLGTDSGKQVTNALDDPGGPFQPYVPKTTSGVTSFLDVKWKGALAPKNV